MRHPARTVAVGWIAPAIRPVPVGRIRRPGCAGFRIAVRVHVFCVGATQSTEPSTCNAGPPQVPDGPEGPSALAAGTSGCRQPRRNGIFGPGFWFDAGPDGIRQTATETDHLEVLFQAGLRRKISSLSILSRSRVSKKYSSTPDRFLACIRIPALILQFVDWPPS